MQGKLFYLFVMNFAVAALHAGNADDNRNREACPEPHALIQAEAEYLKWADTVSKSVVV